MMKVSLLNLSAHTEFQRIYLEANSCTYCYSVNMIVLFLDSLVIPKYEMPQGLSLKLWIFTLTLASHIDLLY